MASIKQSKTDKLKDPYGAIRIGYESVKPKMSIEKSKSTKLKDSYGVITRPKKKNTPQIGYESVQPKMSNQQYEDKIKKIATMLKKSYAAELAKKHCTVVIPFNDRPEIIMTMTDSQNKQKSKSKSKTITEVVLCQTTLKTGKRAGQKCGAKASTGTKFCKRHS